jgi:phage shock protein C
MKRFEKIFSGTLYRSRNGIILGVCRGIADYFNFSVFWTRAIFLLLFLITGFWSMAVIYFIAALLMKPEPVIPLQINGEKDFYDSYVQSRKASIGRLKRRYENLERRIQRMEHVVTSREFDWEHRLNT